ncbi:MAG: copper-binding protein [Methanosarcinales archaeon]|nr:MAG: copper-binding protein [Methanosarcinales archaeon]
MENLYKYKSHIICRRFKNEKNIDNRIDCFNFFPAEVVIARGGTVTWRQKDSDKHIVIGAGFESLELSQGQTFQHKFEEIGVYDYKCKIHASMKGKIIVK